MKKYFLLFIGFVMLFMTYVGIILPGIPGMPFLIIAFFCFSSSSDKVLHWMLRLPMIGYLTKKIMEMKKKKWFIWLLLVQLLSVSIILERFFYQSIFVSIAWYLITILFLGTFLILYNRKQDYSQG